MDYSGWFQETVAAGAQMVTGTHPHSEYGGEVKVESLHLQRREQQGRQRQCYRPEGARRPCEGVWTLTLEPWESFWKALGSK